MNPKPTNREIYTMFKAKHYIIKQTIKEIHEANDIVMEVNE